MRNRCATQYPIVLIHGSGYRDNNKIGYWGRIPAALREEGAQVYCSRQDAWGALETNVELLKDNILHALSDAGADKVNLIAHSRGGIEARQVIHHPMLTGKIASLTTISTPHHGSRTMDALTKPPQWMHKFLSLFVNGWFRLWGDKHPDFFHSSRQFTSAWCEEFNRTCPNDPNVYYQSYASSMSCCRSDWMMAFSHLSSVASRGKMTASWPPTQPHGGNFKASFPLRSAGASPTPTSSTCAGGTCPAWTSASSTRRLQRD